MRPTAVFAYGLVDFLGMARERLLEQPVTSDRDADDVLETLDDWVAGVQQRGRDAILEGLRQGVASLVDDFDLIAAIPGELSHIPQVWLYLGYMHGACAVRAGNALARSLHDGRRAYGLVAHVLEGRWQEARRRWLAEWAALGLVYPWLPEPSWGLHVELVDANTLDPVFVVGPPSR